MESFQSFHEYSLKEVFIINLSSYERFGYYVLRILYRRHGRRFSESGSGGIAFEDDIIDHVGLGGIVYQLRVILNIPSFALDDLDDEVGFRHKRS